MTVESEDANDDPIAVINRDETTLADRVKIANETTLKGLEARRQAFTRVMLGKAIGDDVKIFTDALRRFCRGDTSAWDEDARTHALLTGRQEVWIFISDFSRLSQDEIVDKYTQPYEAKVK